MKNFIKKNYILIIISLFISILIGFLVSKSLFNDYQFAILTAEDGDYLSIGTKDDVKLLMNKNKESYTIELPDYYTGYNISLSYKKVDNKIEEVYVNNDKIETYKLNCYTAPKYEELTLFNVKRKSNTFIYSFVILSIVLFALFLFVFHKRNKESKDDNSSFVNILGKKHIIITSLIVLLTIFLVCGCDASVIVNAERWFIDGVDIYQFQINTRNLLGTIYAQFPYNPISMYVYGGFFWITSLITKGLPLVRSYPYFQVFLLKFVNLVLIQATIINVLKYLYNKKKVSKTKLLVVYYLSIFNPVLFYVAFIFVQLDPLSLFLISLGLISLEKIKDNNYIGVLFVTLGLVIKTQLLVLFPIVLLSILVYSYNKEKFLNGTKKIITSGFIMLIIALVFYLSNNIVKSPFYLLNAKLLQAERIYYTIVNYLGPTSIFVSIFCIGLIVFKYAFSIKIKTDATNLTKTNLIYMMILIFVLSATIVPTPSIYVLSLPAFMVLLYDEEEYFKMFLITGLSIGIIVLPMLSDYGDISILISGFNHTSFLMDYMSKLDPGECTRLNNIIFTVSSASMIAYSLLGLRKTNKYMEEK